MIDENIINKIINDNYIVLKAFDVVDGDMSFNDYVKHISTKNKKGDTS